MKGKRVLLIVCVIVLCFAGVGYSAWSEGLSIKSFFETGNIEIVFEDAVIVDNELYAIDADADEGVLNINGEVAPGTTVVVEYDIYNGSSIPVKYNPDEEALPEGFTLEQKDTVIEPGEYLRGNKLTIEPGENELILPFVQNNSNGGGWKEDLEIRWNITVMEEPVVPELEIAITEGAIEDILPPVEPIEDVPDVTEPESSSSGTTHGSNSAPDTNPAVPDPGVSPAEETPATETPVVETPVVETPAADTPVGDPGLYENTSEGTNGTETVTETNDANSSENKTESDKGSEENATDGEK